jgi:hypothetical protein
MRVIIIGAQPTYFIKSPGRACLFGEGDSGYSTVELCIPRDVIVVVGVNDRAEIRVNHFDKTVFPEKKLNCDVSTVKLNTSENPDDYHNIIAMALKICASLSIGKT